MIKLVVFDWNGVLLADTLACMAADNHVLKVFGGRPVNLKQYRDTIIIPAISFYTRHGCNRQELQNNTKELGNVFHEYYEPRASKCRSRKGAMKLLQWLSKKQIKSIILSNHTVHDINYHLKRLKFEKYISELLANTKGDTSMKERTKSLKLKHYIKNQNYKANEVMIIGDSPEEVEMGKSAGIRTVSITGGYYSTSRLKKANPHFLVDTLVDLIKIIKNS